MLGAIVAKMEEAVACVVRYYLGVVAAILCALEGVVTCEDFAEAEWQIVTTSVYEYHLTAYALHQLVFGYWSGVACRWVVNVGTAELISITVGKDVRNTDATVAFAWVETVDACGLEDDDAFASEYVEVVITVVVAEVVLPVVVGYLGYRSAVYACCPEVAVPVEAHGVLALGVLADET